MTIRIAALLLSASFAFAQPAAAQSDQELAQMRLYVQQLEEQVRRLTGENERLTYELQQARGGQPGVSTQPGAAAPLPGGTQQGALPQQPGLGTPPQDLGNLSIAQDDPLVAPDGAGMPGGPIDLSTLAAGQGAGSPYPAQPSQPDFGGQPLAPQPVPGIQDPHTQTAGLPQAPQISGSARDEYDVAYGSILSGDYPSAEQQFRAWLVAFPNDPLSPDAQFWLGESLYQQGKAREAANMFLQLHKMMPQSQKAPEALMRLGMSLVAMGEKNAACATLAEVSRRYPNASPVLVSRVNEEIKGNSC